MHLEMLTKAGIRLMENIYMDEIVDGIQGPQRLHAAGRS
jgi:hypothetical protein